MKKFNTNNIIYEVTDICNLNCRYCYNIWKIPGQKRENNNSYKKAKKTLKKMFKLIDFQSITFTGGEPLLSERINELILYAGLKSKSITVISNGSAAENADYKLLIKLGVKLFEFPIHSYNPGTHDKITQVEFSWKKSVDSIKSVKSLNGNVAVDIVLTKINHKDIEKTLLFLKDMGIKRILLLRFNIGGEGIKEKNNILLTKKELQTAFKKANKIAEQEKIIITSNVCTPICILDPKNYPEIGFSFCSTDITKRPLTIDINGNMRICNHSPVIMGNIYKENINNIVNSDYVKSWKKIIPEYCESCDLYRKCKGGCRAASEQLNLGLKTVDPIIL